MEKHFASRNVALYKLFVLFNEPLFWGPILIISLQRLGLMSLPDIYFMESAVIVILILLNAPTGALADVIGRKKTLIIGRIILLVSIIGFAMITSPLGAWIANIIWAIGFAFQSGSDEALLYNTLKDAGMEKSFIKIQGCAVGSRYILIAFCSLGVGFLAEINLRLPLVLSVPFVLIPLIASFFLKEEMVLKDHSARKQFEVLKKGIVFVVKKPKVRWIVGLCALLMGASKIWFFTYNPYFEKVGLSLTSFGFIFFLLNIVAWASSHYAHRIEKLLSERMCVTMMILCVGAPILIMGMFPFWPMAFLIIIQNLVRGFMKPFVGNFTNKHIDSEEIRATALSVCSTLTETVSSLSLFCFGLMDKKFGLLLSLVVLGIIVLVLGKFSYARYKSLFPEIIVRA